MNRYQGTFHYQGKAKSHRAVLFKGSSESINLEIELDNDTVEQVELPFSQVTATPKLGQTQRYISCSTLGEFTPLDKGCIDEIFGADPSTKLSHWEQKKRYWIGALVASIVSLWFIVVVVIPAVARSLVPLVPEDVVIAGSNKTLETMDSTLLDPSELPLDKQKALKDMWQKSVRQLGLSPTNYRLLFRDMKQIPNAFALPDGTMVVTDELVNRLQDEPDAILSILLHEMGHVEHQHGMRNLFESMATTILITYIIGDVEGILEFFSGAATTIVANRFSREHETQADDYSFEQLQRLGISTNAFAKAMEAITQEENASEWDTFLSTHPATKERIERARELAK